jgi:transcriptional regulator with XRE-family HTH domain
MADDSEANPALPTLSGYLRAARKACGLTRERLARAAAVSSSYLAQLEAGEKTRPSETTLRALASVLELGPIERRHLFNLVRAGSVPIAEPKTFSAVPPTIQLLLDHLEPHRAALLDDHWDVLAANNSYLRAFPGIDAAPNVMRWVFASPGAKEVIVDWETEAAHTVHWLRGYIGAGNDVEWGAAVVADLADDPDFRRLWADEMVTFDRPEPFIHLRDPDTGEPYTVAVHQFANLAEGEQQYLFVGIRMPYNGPDLDT